MDNIYILKVTQGLLAVAVTGAIADVPYHAPGFPWSTIVRVAHDCVTENARCAPDWLKICSEL